MVANSVESLNADRPEPTLYKRSLLSRGVGADRARLVADYYRYAAGETKAGYPIINEQATASLQESFEDATVELFVRNFKRSLLGDKDLSQLSDAYDGYNQLELSQLITQMVSRYNTD